LPDRKPDDLLGAKQVAGFFLILFLGFLPWASVADEGRPIPTDKKGQGKKVIKEEVDLGMLEDLDLFLNLEMMQILEGLEEDKQPKPLQGEKPTKEKP